MYAVPNINATLRLILAWKSRPAAFVNLDVSTRHCPEVLDLVSLYSTRVLFSYNQPKANGYADKKKKNRRIGIWNPLSARRQHIHAIREDASESTTSSFSLIHIEAKFIQFICLFLFFFWCVFFECLFFYFFCLLMSFAFSWILISLFYGEKKNKSIDFSPDPYLQLGCSCA